MLQRGDRDLLGTRSITSSAARQSSAEVSPIVPSDRLRILSANAGSTSPDGTGQQPQVVLAHRPERLNSAGSKRLASRRKTTDYGLPEIGKLNVVAILVRQRSGRAIRAAQEEPAKGDASQSRPRHGDEGHQYTAHRTHKTHTFPPCNFLSGHTARPKGPPSRRMHIALDEKLADYLNRAWRTHERQDRCACVSLCRGCSGRAVLKCAHVPPTTVRAPAYLPD